MLATLATIVAQSACGASVWLHGLVVLRWIEHKFADLFTRWHRFAWSPVVAVAAANPAAKMLHRHPLLGRKASD